MRGITEYQTVALESSDQRELVVLCFETLIRRQNQAKDASAEGRYMEAIEAVRVAREIYCELLLAIDQEASPEMGQNLSSLYDWCIRMLATVGQEYNTQVLDQTLRVTQLLHDGFSAAFNEAE